MCPVKRFGMLNGIPLPLRRFATALLLCAVFAFVSAGRTSGVDVDGGGAPDPVKPSAGTESTDALRRDRDNLLKQAKRLLKENRVLKALKDRFEGLTDEKEDLLSGKKWLARQMVILNSEIEEEKKKNEQIQKELKRLVMLHERLKRKKEELDALLAEAKSESGIGKLEDAIRSLQNENRVLRKEREKSGKQAAQLSSKIKKDRTGFDKTLEKQKGDAEQKFGEYENRLKETQEKYAAESKERKALGQELTRLPGKFGDIARENARLARTAADRHYNLGVFYSKNAEYRRAVAEFEEALRIKPDHAYALYNLGHIYATYIVDRKKAILHFKEYLKVSPTAKDRDLVLKYIITWEAMGEKE